MTSDKSLLFLATRVMKCYALQQNEKLSNFERNLQVLLLWLNRNFLNLFSKLNLEMI